MEEDMMATTGRQETGRSLHAGPGSPVRPGRFTFRMALGVSTGLLAGLALAGAATAQPQPENGWPGKPIRLVVPSPAGAPSDTVARLVAEKMQPMIRQPVVVENRGGANGTLGTGEVARSPADGYTWMFATDSVLTVNPHVYRNMSFKREDVVPLMIVTRLSQTLVCNPALGVKTLKEFLAKARETKLDYASGGAGSPGHLAMELLIASTGIELNHIPYKGPPAAVQDVVGNITPCGFLAGPTVLPFVKSGRLVALAVSGSGGSPSLPDVPSVAKAGVPGYDATFSLVLSAPRNMPPGINAAFTKAFAQALQAPDLIEKLKTSDQAVAGSTQAEAAAEIERDYVKWGEVARRIKLQPD